MAEFDHGVKLIAGTTGRQLARLAGVSCQPLQPLESTVQATTEMLADRAFLARQRRQRFVLYFEFYTTWDSAAPWDMLAKAGLLSQRERLPTVCLVFILLPRRYKRQGGQFRLEATGGPTQQLWFREVCLWEVEPEAWWEEVPRLMPLYPLCRHGRRPAEAVRLAAGVIERGVNDQVERADILFLLSLFGGLAYPRLDVAGLIGREKMRESKFGRELREEGREEGRLATLHQAVLDVVEGRFGAEATTEVEPLVNALADVNELARLHRLAVISANLAEFRTALVRR